MTWELLIACVGLAGAVCAIVFGVINNRRADDRSTKDDATRLARIDCKLDNVNTGVQDMRVEVRTHGNQIADHFSSDTFCHIFFLLLTPQFPKHEIFSSIPLSHGFRQ